MERVSEGNTILLVSQFLSRNDVEQAFLFFPISYISGAVSLCTKS